MKIMDNLPAIFVVGFLVIGGGVYGYRYFAPPKSTAIVKVRVPALSPTGKRGAAAFAKYCAACHGVNAAGSDKGPPLVHDIYNPGHHGDAAFVMAARRGVRSHHWRFGNMPPRPEVSDADLQAIIRYIRELQTANGIFYKKHRM